MPFSLSASPEGPDTAFLEDQLLNAQEPGDPVQDSPPPALEEDLPEGEGSSELNVVGSDMISLDLKGMNIIELLRVLAMKTGLTIVPSKGVSGRITLFLNNVSFQEALDIILITQNLACERRGNIIYVMSAAEYKRLYGQDYIENREHVNIKLRFADPSNVFTVLNQLKSDIGKVIIDKASGVLILIDIPEKIELMTKTAKQLDTPLETAVFDLNYAEPDEIQSGLTDVVTPGTGKIILDKRSSKVIVSDLPEKMDKIKTIVEMLDSEEKEVFVEAEIVQLTLIDSEQRGVNWEAVFGDSTDIVSNFSSSSALSNSGQITIGTLASDDYTGVLEVLKTYGDIKILSNPKLAVVNNQEARIMVGTRDAYVTQTLSQAESTTVTSESIEFIDVGVKLNIVPTINSEGFITMTIKPEVSSVSETLTTSLGSSVPIVETSEVETVVKVKDNATIMLAGLRQETDRDEQLGIPGLYKLPIVGGLFGNQNKTNRQTELIVFITPHIISGDESIKNKTFDTSYFSQGSAAGREDDVFLLELENAGLVSDVEEDEGLIFEEQSSGFEEKLKGIK